jgi:hypothetical protein
MMSEYHITEYGRQKILKEVAMKVQRLVVDLTWYERPELFTQDLADTF